MERRRVFSRVRWESEVGYCRALRVGNLVYVSGTAPIDENGRVFAPGDAYRQTQFCLQKAIASLQELDATVEDVVRTRLYVTDISRASEYGRSHQEFFGDCPPVTAMVEVKALIDPEMLVEIEVEAIS